MVLMPSVIEKVGSSSRAFDLPSKLLNDRIVYLQGVIDEDSANNVIMQLLWLNSDSSEDIELYINSKGGEIYQGLAIWDIIHRIGCKVNTTGIGLCASMGAYLLFSGTGERRVTSNCRIMIHSASSGTIGNVHDMKVDMAEALYLQEKMLEHIVEFSNNNLARDVLDDMTYRDKYMDGHEAIKLGLIDKVL